MGQTVPNAMAHIVHVVEIIHKPLAGPSLLHFYASVNQNYACQRIVYQIIFLDLFAHSKLSRSMFQDKGPLKYDISALGGGWR